MPVRASWKNLRRRFCYWLRHSERQRLLWEEMEFHIESMTQDSMAEGMSEPEARAAARRKFGNMTQKSEEARFTWIARWISDLAQDLRYAFHGMRRDAGFTAFAGALGSLLFGISAGDPATFIEVGALLIVVAAIAGYVPAWKASRIDPMVALRSNWVGFGLTELATFRPILRWSMGRSTRGQTEKCMVAAQLFILYRGADFSRH